MDLRDDSKRKMFNTFDSFQDKPENAAIYAGNAAYMAQKAKFKAALIPINELAALLIVDNSGYNAEKVAAKNKMAQMASLLSGYAMVYFNETAKPIEAAKLHISETDYSKATDTDSSDMAQAAWQLLTDNITGLNPDYVIQDDLNKLQQLISTFISTQGTSTAVQQGTPAQRKSFKANIKKQMDNIAQLRLLARKYKISNPDFYNQLIANSTPPPVNVHHTTFSATAKNKADNSAVADADASLSCTKKTGNSDENGFITIDQIRAGTAVLTIKAPTYKDNISSVQIVSGHDNHFDILMEKI